MEFLAVFAIWALIGGVVGLAIGDLGGKKNGAAGALLGALLGPIGWIIVAVLPPAGGETQTKSSVTNDDSNAKIARMEAELAALKKGKVGEPKRIGNDDGEIPTYKLD